MTNFMEKVKDFLYDAIDYVLILVIIVGVAAIIGWRLDILFAKDMDKATLDSEPTNVTPIASDNKNGDNDSLDSEKDPSQAANEDNNKDIEENHEPEPDSTDREEPSNEDSPTVSDEIITVKIPSGTLPPTIANILLEKGLIDNKMDFLIKSQELKLDTRLKSGEFQIKKGIGLEELIKLLAR